MVRRTDRYQGLKEKYISKLIEEIEDIAGIDLSDRDIERYGRGGSRSRISHTIGIE